jgi:glycosyltransferase involved in cell wall biosynthesis
MTRILLVAEPGRSISELRRPWARRLHRFYLRAYRRRLVRAVDRLPRAAELTVLASRDVASGSSLAPRARVRLYDEEVYQNDSGTLSELGRRLIDEWWPPREEGSPLVHRGVWLPDLLPVAKGIVLRLDVLEHLGTIERLLDEIKPTRVVLLTGASVAEQVARALSRERGIPLEVADRFLAARGAAATLRWLRAREDDRAVRLLVAERRRRPPSPPAAPHVVFSICRARHLSIAEPVAGSLRARGIGARVLASTRDNTELAPSLERIGKEGIPGVFLMDYLPRKDARRIVARLRPALRRRWRRLAGDGAWRGRLRHGGADLAPIVAPLARDAICSGLIAARLLIEAAFRALETGRPEAVIVASDRRLHERAVALAARALGIPCMLFWGGALLGRDGINRFDVADRVLVLGEHARDGLVRSGMPADRVAIVGDPRSNAARLIPRAELRRGVHEHFGLSDDRPLYVLVSKYVSLLFSAEEKAQLFRSVSEARRRLGDPHVIVKVHPNENLALLRDQVAAWGWPNALLTQDYDIHRLFAAADAAIMVTSMAGLEAMTLGCPVVAMQTAGKDFEGGSMPPYVSAGVVEHVILDAPEALAAALTRLELGSPAREALVARARAFAAPYLHAADGRLADRLLGVLEEVRAGHAGAGAR